MNLFLLREEQAQEPEIELTLDDERAHHLRSIKNISEGDSLPIGVIGRGKGLARVVSFHKQTLRLQLGDSFDSSTGALSFVTIIVAAARPQIMKRVLYHAGMFGIGKLLVVGAERSEQNYFQSKVLKHETYERHIMLGLEQGMHTVMPTVALLPRFFQGDIAKQLEEQDARFVAHLGDYENLFAATREFQERRGLTLAVGPEGGWQGEEIQALKEVGFIPFCMGRSVLRVDTAMTALCAQVQLLSDMKAL